MDVYHVRCERSYVSFEFFEYIFEVNIIIFVSILPKFFASISRPGDGVIEWGQTPKWMEMEIVIAHSNSHS